MNFLKVAGRDIKSIFKNRVIRVSVIAIIIVPLLYSLLYLDAFWDPYSRLQNLPVAVVNNDKGVTVDGEESNFGKDLVDELRGNTQVGWKFTDDSDATSGLEGNKYYAKFVIPSDFSKKVVSAKDGKPEIANLKFVCNEKKNFLSAQINSKVESELKEKIIESVTKNYVSVSFDKLYEIKDKMGLAADGSEKLYNGIDTLNKKIPELEKGANALSDGANSLYDGQVQLKNAIVAMNEGLASVNSKIPGLSDGMTQLYYGSKELNDGVKTANKGAGELSKGSQGLYTAYNNVVYKSVKDLKEGANNLNAALSGQGTKPSTQNDKLDSLKSNIEKSNNNIIELKNQLNRLIVESKEGNNKLDLEITKLENAINSNSDDISQIIKNIKLYQSNNKDNTLAISNINSKIANEYNNIKNDYDNAIKNANPKESNLVNAQMEEIKKGIAKLSNGLNALEYGLNENNKGSFGSGFKSLNENIAVLNSGTSKLEKGSESLSQGLGSANSNMPVLKDGLKALYSGSEQMLDGSSKLVDGQEQLKGGVGKLTGSVPELKDGTQKLYDGSKELSEKLKDGEKELKNGLVNSSEDMGEFVSSPVNMDIAPINPVPNYGTGFAPYFISLSLWIGAIMMFFVIPSKTADDENTSKFAKVFGKFLSFGFVGVLQGLLVGFAVMRLGLNPTDKVLYYGSIVFFSLVFISIVQCFIFLLGDAGRLLSIVLLILQLTACAGTFPLEIVPDFFKVINPYMPFTYTVNVLREAISATTVNYSVISKDIFILFAVMIVFLVISITLKNVGEKIQEAIEGRKREAIVTDIESNVKIAK
ncbi:MAG: YhgE/Pip domain-containing protein [Clostridium sp.]